MAYAFVYDGDSVGKGGTATLPVDGQEVAGEKCPQTITFRMSLDETLDIGEDTGTPLSEDYHVPFNFTRKREEVTINLTDQPLKDEQLRKFRGGSGRARPF